jgi:hypothetical protein
MSGKKKSKAKITRRRMAGPDHAVVTAEGGSGDYMRSPCKQCPWRVDQTGSFPPEAFVHSAETAYDMSSHTFACHMTGLETPATCAGFLCKGADDNLSVRLQRMNGNMLDVTDGGLKLHRTYRKMAEANGVAPDHMALIECMPEARFRRMRPRK